MEVRVAVIIVRVFFIISIILNILLGVHIVRMDKECQRSHVDEINRGIDWYPDADAATEIAEACIGMDQSHAEAVYNIQITYRESIHEWIIAFEPKDEGTQDTRVIGIRRDTGVITEYDGQEEYF